MFNWIFSKNKKHPIYLYFKNLNIVEKTAVINVMKFLAMIDSGKVINEHETKYIEFLVKNIGLKTSDLNNKYITDPNSQLEIVAKLNDNEKATVVALCRCLLNIDLPSNTLELVLLEDFEVQIDLSFDEFISNLDDKNKEDFLSLFITILRSNSAEEIENERLVIKSLLKIKKEIDDSQYHMIYLLLISGLFCEEIHSIDYVIEILTDFFPDVDILNSDIETLFKFIRGRIILKMRIN